MKYKSIPFSPWLLKSPDKFYYSVLVQRSSLVRLLEAQACKARSSGWFCGGGGSPWSSGLSGFRV